MMKSSLFAAVAIAAATVSAAPLEKRQAALTDGDILNFALTLEHLENAFYAEGLGKFNAAAFTSAGFSTDIHDKIQQIANDEASHVSFLTSALQAAGATPVQACTYKFPYTDVKSFLAVSQILEGVGVSAYLGAASSITAGAYLTAAGSILTVEARHNAYVRFVNGESPFPGPFDTPITPRPIVTLASPFFASCPQGSAPTLTGFPAVTITGTAAPGSELTVASANATGATTCAFLSGLDTATAPYSGGKCTIPTSKVANGQVYVFLTSSTNVTDATTIAGPGIINVNPTQGGSSQNSGSTSGGSSGGSGSGSGSSSTSGASSLMAGGVFASAVAGFVALMF